MYNWVICQRIIQFFFFTKVEHEHFTVAMEVADYEC